MSALDIQIARVQLAITMSMQQPCKVAEIPVSALDFDRLSEILEKDQAASEFCKNQKPVRYRAPIHELQQLMNALGAAA